MNISKFTRMHIAETCNAIICAPAECQVDNITILDDMDSVKKFYPHNEYIYQYLPETLLTVDELADNKLFTAKKKMLCERNSTIYGILVGLDGDNIQPVKCEAFTSRNKFLEKARRCVIAYAFAAPAALTLLTDTETQVGKTQKLDKSQALVYSTPISAELGSISTITLSPFNMDILNGVDTARTSIEPDDFWNIRPWELAKRYTDIAFAVPDSGQNYKIERLYYKKSAVQYINFIKKKIIEFTDTRKGYIIGNPTVQTTFADVISYSVPNKMIVYEAPNNHGPYVILYSVPDKMMVSEALNNHGPYMIPDIKPDTVPSSLSLCEVFNKLIELDVPCPSSFTVASTELSMDSLDDTSATSWGIYFKIDTSFHSSRICTTNNLLRCLDVLEGNEFEILSICPKQSNNNFKCDALSELEPTENNTISVEDIVKLYLSMAGIEINKVHALHVISATIAILLRSTKISVSGIYDNGSVYYNSVLNTFSLREAPKLLRMLNQPANTFFAENDIHARCAIVAINIMRTLNDTESDLYWHIYDVLKYCSLMCFSDGDLAVPSDRFQLNLNYYI